MFTNPIEFWKLHSLTQYRNRTHTRTCTPHFNIRTQLRSRFTISTFGIDFKAFALSSSRIRMKGYALNCLRLPEDFDLLPLCMGLVIDFAEHWLLNGTLGLFEQRHGKYLEMVWICKISPLHYAVLLWSVNNNAICSMRVCIQYILVRWLILGADCWFYSKHAYFLCINCESTMLGLIYSKIFDRNFYIPWFSIGILSFIPSFSKANNIFQVVSL